MPGLLDTKGYDFYTCALIASYLLRLLVLTESDYDGIGATEVRL